MNRDTDVNLDNELIADKSQIVSDVFHEWENLVSEIVSYHSRSLKVEHLKLPSFFIMNYLYRNGPQNLSTLASITGVSRPTITCVIDNLEGHGLVVRSKEKNDRRKLVVELTDLAREKMGRIYFNKEEVKKELAISLTNEQLTGFLESMVVLGGIMKRVTENKLNELLEGEED